MPEARRREAPDRNLALELVRVTEAGAMAAGRWVGRGDKEGGDGAAVDAMRELVNSVSMRGVVVIGEGEKDHAPMLYNGEEVGNGDGPECDFAVDPVDGTTLMSKGMPNAISVLAVAERGAMFDPSAVFYMDKIAVGPDAVDAIDITAPIGENIRRVAKIRNATASDITVVILDRPRHAKLIDDVRAAGARIRLITDGDVAGAISACRPDSGTDMLAGIGGTPEGIIAAAAIRCMGGAIQAKLAPTDDAERQKAIDAGYDLDQVLTTEDLVSGENVFFCATGVTDGDLLHGVRYYGGGCTTQSIVMRSKSGTVRMIEAYHRLSKLNEYSAVDFTGDCYRRTPAAITPPTKREHMSADSAVEKTAAEGEYRIEHDTMGEVRVPIAALWRAQTQRAVENFPISGRGLERTQIRALGLLKGACAQVNKDLGPARSREGRRHHRRGGRDRRRPARRPVPHRRVPDRLGHQFEHERQRGDRRHRRAERRHGAPQRRRQHVAVVQRHLPHRNPHRGHRSRCAAPAFRRWRCCTRRWCPRPASGAPWSSPGAPT